MNQAILLLLLLGAVIAPSRSDRLNNMPDKNSDVLKITTIKNSPFVMVKENQKGNDRFEGFIPDFLQKLSELTKFKYAIHLVKDQKYGHVLDGKWNGMPGEVLSGDADIAAADLTITAARREVVEFTVPFMTSGIGIIMKKPPPPEMDPWFFAKPFSSQVWLCTFISFLGITIFMFILGRFSGADWNHQSDPSAERTNNLNVTNALYFVYSSLVLQNSRIAPRGTAPRILSCVWWSFCLFLFSCYIANLAAILVNKMDLLPEFNEIKNVEELSQQTKVKYGMIKAGSTYTFFKKSQLPIYQLMFSVMDANPSVFVSSYAEGMQKVRQGDYAMFMESTSISYVLSKDCEMTQVGGLLDYRGYGLALKKDHPLTHNLSINILKLQEEGFILKLIEKWWGKGDGNKCPVTEMDDFNRGALGMSSVRGVFIFLLIGFIVAFVVALVELCWKAKNNTKEAGGSLCSEVIRESKYALCGGGPSPKANGKKHGRHEDGMSLERQEDVVMI